MPLRAFRFSGMTPEGLFHQRRTFTLKRCIVDLFLGVLIPATAARIPHTFTVSQTGELTRTANLWLQNRFSPHAKQHLHFDAKIPSPLRDRKLPTGLPALCEERRRFAAPSPAATHLIHDRVELGRTLQSTQQAPTD